LCEFGNLTASGGAVLELMVDVVHDGVLKGGH